MNTLSKKVVDLTARSMANNIVISGITGDSEKKEDCKSKVVQFMRTQLKIDDLLDQEVEVAHHAKGKLGPKPRQMIVRCHFKLRDRLFYYTKHLKRITNSQVIPILCQSSSRNHSSQRNGNVTYVSKRYGRPMPRYPRTNLTAKSMSK